MNWARPSGKVEIDVADILQEVSIEALRSLSETDFEHREVFSWLCQLAERKIIDAHRRHFGAQMRDARREMPLGNAGGASLSTWGLFICWPRR